MRDGSGFVVAGLKTGSEVARENEHTPELYEIATTARIVDWNGERDGKLGVLIAGEQRVRLSEIHTQKDFLMLAQTEALEEADDVSLPEEYASLAGLLKQLAKHPAVTELREVFNYTSAQDVSNALSHYLPVDLHLKYPLLEQADPVQRLQGLQVLANELSGADTDIR
jgi:Lon protease-like protein